MRNMSKLEGILFFIVLCILVTAVLVLLPDSPLGTKCMDAWCLN